MDDARAVHERAVEFAEAARLRNQAKVTERLAATQASIIKGKPLPEGLKDVDALSLMKADERDERLEKLDSMYEEFASGYAVYHPIRDED